MKRQALTADDLLRLQDDVHTKRPRLAFRTTVRRRYAEDATSDYSMSELDGSQASVSSREKGSESQDEYDEGASRLSSEDENDAVVRPPLDIQSSRISIVPRAETTPTAVRQETQATPVSTSFASLGISPILLKALSSMSIRAPTEVQAACIPPLLQGKSTSGSV